jgi:uncharacterized coiled-coil protein SlyX
VAELIAHENNQCLITQHDALWSENKMMKGYGEAWNKTMVKQETQIADQAIMIADLQEKIVTQAKTMEDQGERISMYAKRINVYYMENENMNRKVDAQEITRIKQEKRIVDQTKVISDQLKVIEDLEKTKTGNEKEIRNQTQS